MKPVDVKISHGNQRDDYPHKASSEDCQQPKLEAVQELESREAIPAHSPIFDPEVLELLCRRDLPAALRQLADHLERKEITGSLWNFQGNSMVQDWRRAHFLMTLDLAVQMSPQKPS